MVAPTPIPPILPTARIDVRPGEAGVRQAQIGELLRLLVTQGANGALQGRAESGLQLTLPAGLAQAGDVLLMRVQTLLPKLELQLLQRHPAPGGAAMPAAAPESRGGSADGNAMRTDQAWLLQQRLLPAAAAGAQAAAPLAVKVAEQWRAQVLAEQLRPSAGPQSPPEAEGAARQAVPILLQGWTGQALWLRLLSPHPAPVGWLPPRDEEEPSAQRHRDPAQQGEPDEAGEGLRLGLILSLNGDWVQVLLQWQQGGLLLHLSAERAETLQQLRALLPTISAALAAVPLPVRHCQLSSRPPALPPLPKTQQAHGLAHASSGPLFRAAAEIAGVLQQGA